MIILTAASPALGSHLFHPLLTVVFQADITLLTSPLVVLTLCVIVISSLLLIIVRLALLYAECSREMLTFVFS